jgi:hypothetical protein
MAQAHFDRYCAGQQRLRADSMCIDRDYRQEVRPASPKPP